MVTVLLCEGNTPPTVAAGLAGADGFLRVLPPLAADLGLDLRLVVASPYERPIRPADLDGCDGAVFTGSVESWSVDDQRAAPQREAITTIFEHHVPVWGSCNGMQLGAHVLGGVVGASPNGYELGWARKLETTEIGASHVMMVGRDDAFEAPCLHRDEVTSPPTGAVVLACNGHSPIQALAYEADGVRFWGTQYHPELGIDEVARILNAQTGLFSSDQARFSDEQVQFLDEQVDTAHGSVTAQAAELVNWLRSLTPAP